VFAREWHAYWSPTSPPAGSHIAQGGVRAGLVCQVCVPCCCQQSLPGFMDPALSVTAAPSCALLARSLCSGACKVAPGGRPFRQLGFGAAALSASNTHMRRLRGRGALSWTLAGCPAGRPVVWIWYAWSAVVGGAGDDTTAADQLLSGTHITLPGRHWPRHTSGIIVRVPGSHSGWLCVWCSTTPGRCCRGKGLQTMCCVGLRTMQLAASLACITFHQRGGVPSGTSTTLTQLQCCPQGTAASTRPPSWILQGAMHGMFGLCLQGSLPCIAGPGSNVCGQVAASVFVMASTALMV
jgi:hypothetical protein